MTNSYPMLGRYVIPDMPSTDELMPYLRQIEDNRWYSNFGPLITRFEDRLTQHLMARDTGSKIRPISLVSLASCYHALQTGLQVLHLPPNAHVLIPAITFPACPLAVRHAGAEAILADVDEETWQLTPETARRVASQTPIHAVMPVAVYGVPVPIEEWDKFMDETGIPVIIDAAAAMESQPVPRKGLIAYSLHATKPFSIGEGGILAGRNREQIDEARSMANFGTQHRICLRDGMNAKLSEYHGAVALAQLDRWEGIKERRRKIFVSYLKFIEVFGHDLAFQNGVGRTIVSTLMLRARKSHAASIVNTLNAQGIAAHRMYLPPLYHHPYFAELSIASEEGKVLGPAPLEKKTGIMKNSEALRDSLFGVPFHPFIQESDIAHMVTAINEIMELPLAKLA